MSEERSDSRPYAFWAAFIVLLGYAALPSWIGEVYPLNRFDLFAFSQPRDSRLVVQDSDGSLSEVWGWSGWACESADTPQQQRPAACLSAIIDPVRDAQIQRHIRTHPLGDAIDAVQVNLVRQLVSIQPGEPPQLELCQVRRCRAVKHE